MTDDSRMTPEGMAKIVAEFRELVEEAKLLRGEFLALVDDIRGALEETRRLQGSPTDDKQPKRPELTLVKNNSEDPAGDPPL